MNVSWPLYTETLESGRREEMRKRIKTLLVCEYELLCTGLRHILELEEDMEVVGDCATVEDVFSQVARLSPDIVLMTVKMQGQNGTEIIRCLKGDNSYCYLDVIVLAECMDDLIEALCAGAAAYMNKNVTREELVQTIRQVYWNERSLEVPVSLMEKSIDLVDHTLVNFPSLVLSVGGKVHPRQGEWRKPAAQVEDSLGLTGDFEDRTVNLLQHPQPLGRGGMERKNLPAPLFKCFIGWRIAK